MANSEQQALAWLRHLGDCVPLARDLEDTLAYEPTAEELGEAVIDLTDDVASQSAPAVPQSSSPL